MVDIAFQYTLLIQGVAVNSKTFKYLSHNRARPKFIAVFEIEHEKITDNLRGDAMSNWQMNIIRSLFQGRKIKDQ